MDIQQILRQYAGAVAASDANIAAQEAAIGNESAALAATYGKMQGLQQSAAALSEEAVKQKAECGSCSRSVHARYAATARCN
jgi:hypothetical protein